MEAIFIRRPWLLPVVLAVLTLILWKPMILPNSANEGLDSKDMQNMNYPLHEFISQTIHAGELPLWNPHEFIGHPVSSNPQSALFYPATWFMWVVGVVRGMNLSLAFHTCFGAYGMAVLMRRFKASYTGSLLAGVIYSMSGLAAARLNGGHYVQYVTLSWIPWLIAAYHFALTRKCWYALLPGIGATGLAILAGHTQMLIYGGICLLALWIYHIAVANDNLASVAWRGGRLLFVMVVCGAILGAALLIPTLELSRLSLRSVTGQAFANTFALPPAQMLTLAIPGLFGNTQVGPFYWGQDYYEEFNAYAGLLPLLAIPLAFRKRRIENWYFLVLIGIGIVLSVGLDGVLMPLLWRWIPALAAFRGPAHALVLIVIGLSGLTGLMVTTLQSSTPEERREWLSPVIRLWLPVTILLSFAAALILAGWYGSASQVEPMPVRAFAISGAMAETGVILLGLWIVIWLWCDSHPKTYSWALLLTCVFVILDAWHVGFIVVSFSSITEDPLWAGARINVPTGADARVVAPIGYENLANVTGHLNIYAYDPLELDNYSRLQAASDSGDPTAPVNTLLGVKYFMTVKPYDKPNFKLIGIADGGIYYRREDAFPRAWVAKNLVVEPNDETVRAQIVSGKQNLQDTVYIDHSVDCPAVGGTASITDYRPNSVVIQTSGSGGLLTLSDQYYPGWQATVDNQSVSIVRTDTAFRGVCVPAGDHIVRFDYRPNSLLIGGAISALGWILWLILILFRRKSLTSVPLADQASS